VCHVMRQDIPIALETLTASVAGAVEIEQCSDGFAPRRLPLWTRDRQASAGIQHTSGASAGIRLRLLTAARTLRLDLRVISSAETLGIRPHPVVVIAEVEGEQCAWRELIGVCAIDVAQVADPDSHGAEVTVVLALDGDGTTERAVEIWLPHNAETVVRGAAADAPVHIAQQRPTARWLHHGSSISHGLEAVGPLGPWPQQAARELGVSLTNLGFAGDAMLDPFVAQTIATQPADVITLKLGINPVTTEAMKERVFGPAVHGFLDLVREGHPTTPIIVISAIAAPGFEDEAGPSREVAPGRYAGTPRLATDREGLVTLARSRAIIADVLAHRADDANLAYLSGLRLLGLADARHLYDGLHPDQAGYDLIARRFVELAQDATSPLGPAFLAAAATRLGV
jgi:lysophospholipase L1-like esterase